ncbi:formylglycine-generating enzyme family protein [Candidatus Leptofilum sp.]|uniref:formylglycine-generating enzyme family protein n=1 Tax=Candidatus Leptofilum sp. TaxID=3241576 RepID=UPI003B5CC716
MTKKSEYSQQGQRVDGHQANIAGDGNIGRIGNTYHIAKAQFDLPPKLIEQILTLNDRQHQEDFTVSELQTETWEPDTLFIGPGTFQMGSQPGDGIPFFETPQFDMTLPAYRIGKYPVTNEQYNYFLDATNGDVPSELGWQNGNDPSEEQSHLPVKGVTWYDALAYCSWLIQETERPYTLPSEAQWELAASLPMEMIGSVREWTTSLWGRNRRHNLDSISKYPWKEGQEEWRPNSGHDFLKESRQIRRVTRGASLLPDTPFRVTRRESELPYMRGMKNGRIGFRVVLNWETAT